MAKSREYNRKISELKTLSPELYNKYDWSNASISKLDSYIAAAKKAGPVQSKTYMSKELGAVTMKDPIGHVQNIVKIAQTPAKKTIPEGLASSSVQPPLVIDTREDVMALQRRLGFKGKDVDGVVGPMTNAAANKAGINLGMTNADAFAPTPKQTIVKQPVQKAQQAQVAVPIVEAKQAYGGMPPEESAKLEAFTVDHNKRVLAGKQAVADSGLSNGWSSDVYTSNESEYAKEQSDAALEKQWKAEEAINRAGLAQELANAKFARQATKQTYM